MRKLQGRTRLAAAAAVVLLALPAAGASAAPRTETDGPLPAALAWIGDWLARALPWQSSAASETPPLAPPDGMAFDDGATNAVECTPETCQEGELLPDVDPNG